MNTRTRGDSGGRRGQSSGTGIADRVRAELFRRIGLENLLHPVVTERSQG